ncbi:MAG: DUF2101 family protein [Candidatus Hadarchaeum sp.]|uniref:DUF2101 family protein n=1 Tax=Candidatus Hadarchaeum sp. TaxID=2883567 RepID=UPI003D116360
MTKVSKFTRLFWQIGNIFLGSDRCLSSSKNKSDKNKDELPIKHNPAIPRKIKGFFESRHAGWPEYVMLKTQIAILSLFVTTTVYLVISQDDYLTFLTLTLIFSFYLFHLTKTQLKLAFKQDYPAYRSFVIICAAISWTLPLSLKVLPAIFTEKSELAILTPTFLNIGLIATTFAAFRLKYGRKFTYGIVEESRGRFALVRVSYDIRSNVKPGIYPVECLVRVNRGDEVKLSVARTLLGLGGAKIKAITEVVD